MHMQAAAAAAYAGVRHLSDWDLGPAGAGGEAVRPMREPGQVSRQRARPGQPVLGWHLFVFKRKEKKRKEDIASL